MALLLFWENGTLMFQEMELSSPITKRFREVTFRARKKQKPTLKKFLTFQEMELSNPKLKKFLIFFLKTFLYFWREFAKPEK